MARGIKKFSVDFCIKKREERNVLCINVTAAMWIEFPGFVFIFNGASLCEHLLAASRPTHSLGRERKLEKINIFAIQNEKSCTGTDQALGGGWQGVPTGRRELQRGTLHAGHDLLEDAVGILIIS